ncbi:LAMI_0G04654g1_1 [Lachancea mirantina]|uniref:LAMI_0G04654g1_1 n=1 Tax=Lachancea mirantina TaxID=1230905 RepID=A0A1G4K8J2_9SACH|nr:LAMI_0G04654g1_1 [Lachancea mirantina]
MNLRQRSNDELKCPRDIFRSRLIYEIFVHKFSTGFSLLALSMGIWCYVVGGPVASAVLMASLVLGGVFLSVLLIAFSVFSDTPWYFKVLIAVALYAKRTSIRNAVDEKLAWGDGFNGKLGWDVGTVRDYMREILIANPGDDQAKWDSIAANMNSVIYVKSWWATPYFFYDGYNCQSWFDSRYVGPFLKDEDRFPPILRPFISAAVKSYVRNSEEQLQRLAEDVVSETASVDDSYPK